jgi:hypothetical protein
VLINAVDQFFCMFFQKHHLSPVGRLVAIGAGDPEYKFVDQSRVIGKQIYIVFQWFDTVFVLLEFFCIEHAAEYGRIENF